MVDVKAVWMLYFTGWCNWNRQLLSNKTWSLFLFVGQVSISSSVSESVCSSTSRRVAFSREIWKAIYRSLPEHQAWCCCRCSYLSLLLTTPASVSLSLHLCLFPLLFLFFVFWAPFLLMSSSPTVSQSSVSISFVHCLLWCKLLIRAEGRRLVAWP